MKAWQPTSVFERILQRLLNEKYCTLHGREKSLQISYYRYSTKSTAFVHSERPESFIIVIFFTAIDNKDELPKSFKKYSYPTELNCSQTFRYTLLC